MSATTPREKLCSEPGCTNPFLAHGRCRKHYLRKYRKDGFPAKNRLGENELKRVYVELSKATVKRLDTLSKTRGMTRAALLRTFVRVSMQRLDPAAADVK